MPTLGINFREGNTRDHALLDRIDEPLEFGDARSGRVRDLIELGLAAEDAVTESGVTFDSRERREEFVREAVRAYADQTEADPDAPSA